MAVTPSLAPDVALASDVALVSDAYALHVVAPRSGAAAARLTLPRSCFDPARHGTPWRRAQWCRIPLPVTAPSGPSWVAVLACAWPAASVDRADDSDAADAHDAAGGAVRPVGTLVPTILVAATDEPAAHGGADALPPPPPSSPSPSRPQQLPWHPAWSSRVYEPVLLEPLCRSDGVSASHRLGRSTAWPVVPRVTVEAWTDDRRRLTQGSLAAVAQQLAGGLVALGGDTTWCRIALPAGAAAEEDPTRLGDLASWMPVWLRCVPTVSAAARSAAASYGVIHPQQTALAWSPAPPLATRPPSTAPSASSLAAVPSTLRPAFQQLVAWTRAPPRARPRGILLHGPPGCGKTLVVSHLARSLGVPLVVLEGGRLTAAQLLVLGEAGAARRRPPPTACVGDAPASVAAMDAVPLRCVVFVDEIDGIVRPSAAGMAPDLTALFAELLDGEATHQGTLYLGATNHPEVLGDALRRPGRFDTELAFTAPGFRDRQAMLADILRLTVTSDADAPAGAAIDATSPSAECATAMPGPVAVTPAQLHHLTLATNGFCGADFKRLHYESFQSARRRGLATETRAVGSPASPALSLPAPRSRHRRRAAGAASSVRSTNTPIHVTYADVADAVTRVRPALVRSATSVLPAADPAPDASSPSSLSLPSSSSTSASAAWGGLEGLDDVLARLEELLIRPLHEPERYAALGVRPARGILLHGPAGTGKTTLVRALAARAGYTCYALDAAQLYSVYLGESERQLRELFRRARATAPSLVFLDEVETLVTNRFASESGGDGGGGGGGATDVAARITSTLLNELDGIDSGETEDANYRMPDVVVVGATNRLHAVDPALKRPGRLEHWVHVPVPDAKGRRALLRHQIGQDRLAAFEAAAAPAVGGFAASEAATPLDALVAASEGWTGAQVKEWAQEAGRHALRRLMHAGTDHAASEDGITPADFEAAAPR